MRYQIREFNAYSFSSLEERLSEVAEGEGLVPVCVINCEPDSGIHLGTAKPLWNIAMLLKEEE